MSAAPGPRPRGPRLARLLTRALLPIAVAAAILVVLPPLWFGDSPYTTGLAVEALVFGCYAVGFNLIFGSTNQLFLCVGALAGVGGYSTAILSDKASLPLAAGVALGTVSAAIVGGLLAWIAVRRSLNVIFTGIVTLVFSLAFTNFIIGQRDLTGADTGYVLQGAATDLADDRVGGYYLFVVVLVVLLIVFRALQLSHVGWAFRALRDDEVAAELAGVDSARHKLIVFVISALFAAFAGGLAAFHAGFVTPAKASFLHSIELVTMVVFGGMASTFGAVVGAAVLTLLPQLLTALKDYEMVVFGALLMATMIFFPRGIVPTLSALWQRWRR